MRASSALATDSMSSASASAPATSRPKLANVPRPVSGPAADALYGELKDAIARQQFEVNIQAAIGNKIVAKERIPPFRKNVLVKSGKNVGGGDFTRKRKLLEKQKRGKARMKTVGKVPHTQKAFWSVLST